MERPTILSQEKVYFKQRTDLDLEVTAPGAYATLLQHIQDHQWFLGINQDREVDWEEAVQSWYDDVYLPLTITIEDIPDEMTEDDLEDVAGGLIRSLPSMQSIRPRISMTNLSTGMCEDCWSHTQCI